MPATTRTIRFFISSTFSDLRAERNALQDRVFPRLKRYGQRRDWSLQSIDLRWGVSHEAALDQSTRWMCRAEIARCRQITTFAHVPKTVLNPVVLSSDKGCFAIGPEMQADLGGMKKD